MIYCYMHFCHHIYKVILMKNAAFIERQLIEGISQPLEFIN